VMSRASSLFRKLSGNRLPLWNPFMPKGADRIRPARPAGDHRPTVVYFPTCINRTMGPARGEEHEPSLATLVVGLLEKAGYAVVFPRNLPNLCCGMAFASKGFKAQGDRKAAELEKSLLEASRNGKLPVLVDMSPCLYRMKETFGAGLRLYDPVKFTLELLPDRLTFAKLPETVAIHTTCSAEKMGLAGGLKKVAQLCAENVVVPQRVGCCGWAGDRGFTYPELNASALSDLRPSLPQECATGYSTSRTCEIGLSLHSGIHYRSILYLVDRCTTRKPE
jgi:D-lactate dehydrogenase